MAKIWHVGCTKDQQELRAAAELRAQGYVVYLPKIYYRHQEGRRIEARSTLRFTGYIFIFCHVDELAPISGTRGMDSGGGSAVLGPLPNGIIETLRVIEDEEFARAVARTKPRPRTDLTPGDWVEINQPDDPFHGKRGYYLGTEKGVARVLLGLVQKAIAECDLKKIEPPQQKRAA